MLSMSIAGRSLDLDFESLCLCSHAEGRRVLVPLEMSPSSVEDRSTDLASFKIHYIFLICQIFSLAFAVVGLCFPMTEDALYEKAFFDFGFLIKALELPAEALHM